jgi:uncharacterized protein YukE
MTTLHRATDGYVGRGSCWAESLDVAQMYQDNPGYGGANLVTCEADGAVLDLVGSRNPWQDLAEALCGDLDRSADELVDLWTGSYAYVYEVWQERKDVRNALAATYNWVRHDQETFPEGVVVWVKVSG